jgi:DNA-binding NarL/FixJ family response regulator
MQNSIRVGIVDGHDIVRESLKIFLEATDDLIFVGEASSEVETRFLCQQENPDVVLCDFLQPEEKGLELIESLLSLFPHLLIIILTTMINPHLVTRAVQAGVVGYLLKQIDIDTLAAAIRCAYNGGATFDEEVNQILRGIKEIMVNTRAGFPYIQQQREITTRIF